VADRVHAALKDNVARGDKLRAMFEGAGCPAGRLELQAVKHARAPNAICTVPGETGQTIVVGAHFDHVAVGLGVIDNWSGAALLPSLLRASGARPAGTRSNSRASPARRMGCSGRSITLATLRRRT
jgi:hypothetical protein